MKEKITCEECGKVLGNVRTKHKPGSAPCKRFKERAEQSTTMHIT